MDKRTIENWIMYHEIQHMLREGYSISWVAKELAADPRTVKKYAAMTEQEYEAFLSGKEARTKLLSVYESFIKDRLIASPLASAAQVHDWLKEHHAHFPLVSVKTVYNFVISVRQKYNIPLEEKASRDYFIVDELPYGLQAQADFGQYYLRNSDQGRKKVHFFIMMLSRSRMKYVYFQDKPFATDIAIQAHEAAFKYFEGIPGEIVYDQDRLFLVNENLGDLLLTREFKEYVFEQELKLHFCRKSDPQSKGKVENVVKYVKQNFLYGRLYHDIDTLQEEALRWLIRTGNGMPHSTTKKIPREEWEIEKQYLKSWTTVNVLPSCLERNVRKDNTIAYQGNFYTVPQGTYNKAPAVLIYQQDGKLIVHDSQRQFICSHKIAPGNGKLIINTDHKRDKRAKIDQLIAETAALFEDIDLAAAYLGLLRKDKGRYIRDHIQAIRDSVTGLDKSLVAQVLQKCVEERYLSANMFKELLTLKQAENKQPAGTMGKIILLDPAGTHKAAIKPDESDLDNYERLFNK